MEKVFSLERGPWSIEREQLHIRREAAQQRGGGRFGEQRDLCVAGGGLQEGERERQIAQTPEFEGKQPGWSLGLVLPSGRS